ncbi:hypothetical protein HMPREF9075_00604 [Capnocytophaga sp. oral taxon 332 str. F0381]|uniref:hypothetical protein n=1 Tax=Capnocytophaga TaxID=1016 RepID=UPI0002A2218A|nr:MULTISPECIES: hypothetical protein [Capnocytophaga]EKY11604.1 hypothetical protein HMPREF9075_00604 [Capnocytophaga sp. oral taxon 332 str. F0381]
MTNQIEFIHTKKEFTAPSATLNYKTNNINTLLLFVGTTFTIFTPANALKENIDMEKDIKLEMLDSYKNLTTGIYSENEDYSKILTNVVTEMLSNTQDFSDINQYINENFWDLV